MNKAQEWIARNILGLKASQPPPNSLIQQPGAGNYLYVNGQITWISDKLASYVTEGYQGNDIVYSIVAMIMDKVRVAPWSLYKVVDESSLKKYNALITSKQDSIDWNEAIKLRTKALEPITKLDSRTRKLNDLLKWPNEYCTFNNLIAESAGFELLTGNNYLWANLLNAGANEGIPQELFNLPAQYIMIKATQNWPQRELGYQMNNGELRQFTVDEVLHDKFWNPEYSLTGAGLYGQSPLKAASKTLTRNNAAKKAGATQLDNNGAAGIAYVDDPIIPSNGRESQAAAVKRAWAKENTGAENFGKISFSGYKMGYVSVGMSLKDMALTDIENVDLRRLCNIWGLPSQLMNDPENKSYNNQKEAEKALTTRCAMPRLVTRRDSINRKLQTSWGFKDQNVYVDFDPSVYPELQEDQKEKWAWVKELTVPEAYKLELMGLDVPDELPKDLILVDSNKVNLQDLLTGMSDEQMQAINDQLNANGLNDYQAGQ
jgi:HK97 family phage portal protein